MTINEHLKNYNLITENGELTERANYLGYTVVADLITDITDTYLIDFREKTIIPSYNNKIYPIAISGETNSDIIKFRLYWNNNNPDLKSSDYIPEIIW